jgi:hypothetical protein
VAFDPESYRPGAVPRRQRRLKASERPFAGPVDRWLAGGGWDAGRGGAGYVVLDVDTETARRRLHNTWAYEKVRRGWTAADVACQFTVVDGETRFYWWSVGDPESG